MLNLKIHFFSILQCKHNNNMCVCVHFSVPDIPLVLQYICYLSSLSFHFTPTVFLAVSVVSIITGGDLVTFFVFLCQLSLKKVSLCTHSHLNILYLAVCVLNCTHQFTFSSFHQCFNPCSRYNKFVFF